MAIYQAAIDPGDNGTGAIKFLRTRVDFGVSEIVRRLKSGEPVIIWNTDDYQLELELAEHHDAIHSEISELQEKGFKLSFRYSPGEDDEFEGISFDELAISW